MSAEVEGMPPAGEPRPGAAQPERSAEGGAQGAACAHCGRPLRGAKPSGACSDRGRVALSRARQAERRRVRDREVLALLEEAERLEWRAAAGRTKARRLLRGGGDG